MAALSRDAIPEKYRWNAAALYATTVEWEAAFEALQERLGELDTYRDSLTANASSLLAWLQYRDTVLEDLGKLRVYVVMDYSTNTLDNAASERFQRLRTLAADIESRFAFAEPAILALGQAKAQEWLQQEAGLGLYQHYLANLFRQAEHVRSAELEELLGALSDPFAAATSSHGILANTDLDFQPALDSSGKPHDITQGTIAQLLSSSDRQLRQSAFEHYADAHLKFRNTMASLLSAGVKQTNLVARTRRYDSALHAALSLDNLPASVFDTLISSFQANLPTWHRYWRAKRRLLGLDVLYEYDIKAPMVQAHPVVSFEQSIDWLCDALAPLGKDYVATMRKGALEERWVDLYPNKGKRMGAFSTSSPGSYSYIMMSYSDDVFGMSTLAHELGHSLHSTMSNAAQPFINHRYTLFAAEVASNFNQAMLRAHLFERFADDATLQLALIEEAMANFHRYFFIMPTLARFEREIHERAAKGQTLSADVLSGLMADLFAEGYGSEVSFERERSGVTWAQFHTHMYSRFYVYKYATGISGAHALAQGIRQGQTGAVERYLEFLRAGGSKYPLDALRDAGVDLARPDAVDETFGVLAALVDRLEGFIPA